MDKITGLGIAGVVVLLLIKLGVFIFVLWLVYKLVMALIGWLDG